MTRDEKSPNPAMWCIAKMVSKCFSTFRNGPRERFWFKLFEQNKLFI